MDRCHPLHHLVMAPASTARLASRACRSVEGHREAHYHVYSLCVLTYTRACSRRQRNHAVGVTLRQTSKPADRAPRRPFLGPWAPVWPGSLMPAQLMASWNGRAGHRSIGTRADALGVAGRSRTPLDGQESAHRGRGNDPALFQPPRLHPPSQAHFGAASLLRRRRLPNPARPSHPPQNRPPPPRPIPPNAQR